MRGWRVGRGALIGAEIVGAVALATLGVAALQSSTPVDGLAILSAGNDHGYLVPEIEAGVAAVFVLRPPALISADAVLADERGGARAAVTHLIGYGHRRVGYVVVGSGVGVPPPPCPLPPQPSPPCVPVGTGAPVGPVDPPPG